MRAVVFVALVLVATVLAQCPSGTCPSGASCCELNDGSYGCCPYVNADCCSDGYHCCPNGYSCDLSSGQCNKNAAINAVSDSTNVKVNVALISLEF